MMETKSISIPGGKWIVLKGFTSVIVDVDLSTFDGYDILVQITHGGGASIKINSADGIIPPASSALVSLDRNGSLSASSVGDADANGTYAIVLFERRSKSQNNIEVKE